jgi:hypothetical protein
LLLLLLLLPLAVVVMVVLLRVPVLARARLLRQLRLDGRGRLNFDVGLAGRRSRSVEFLVVVDGDVAAVRRPLRRRVAVAGLPARVLTFVAWWEEANSG